MPLPEPTDFLLVYRTGSIVHAKIRLNVGETLIGRSSQSDIIVQGKAVSRRHARIVATPSSVEVFDLGSRNGTFVDEQRVVHATLVAGQTLRFGSARFVLVLQPREGDDRGESPPADA